MKSEIFSQLHVHCTSLFAASSSCYNYPCGARACTDIGGGNYECAELSGDMTCGFEAYDTQCDDMIDVFVTGDDIDPIYNTGDMHDRFPFSQTPHTYCLYLHDIMNECC